ncbi:hypothetical protein B0H34DRAFT_671350 [Crassisporium funariophilum]|nr:hypothetical protein B0H34DRAFT_671350 [Crassisporium funariophilum]
MAESDHSYEPVLDHPQAKSNLSFDKILQSSSLPDPGPDFYAARRRLWLTPRIIPVPPPPSSSRQKLEDLLSQPGAIRNQEVWHSGIEKVWKGLSSGGKLKHRLSLNIIPVHISTKIKIIHAAWLRDRTWPVGMEAPDTDEEEPDVRTPDTHQPPITIQPTPIPITDSSEPNDTGTPWIPDRL